MSKDPRISNYRGGFNAPTFRQLIQLQAENVFRKPTHRRLGVVLNPYGQPWYPPSLSVFAQFVYFRNRNHKPLLLLIIRRPRIPYHFYVPIHTRTQLYLRHTIHQSSHRPNPLFVPLACHCSAIINRQQESNKSLPLSLPSRTIPRTCWLTKCHSSNRPLSRPCRPPWRRS